MRVNYKDFCDVSVLVGLTLTAVDGLAKGSEEVVFASGDGRKFLMYHEQDCCESVNIEDVEGDVSDLIGSSITTAEEVDGVAEAPEYAESYTWTFYRLVTAKGFVVVRWLGESNGYYSESVAFGEIK